jgi:hypothetical protein
VKSGPLDELGRRIERVALDPGNIEEQTLFRVARPLLVITGWRAKVRFRALMALFPALREAARTRDASAQAKARAAHRSAIAELEDSIASVERAAIVRKRPPVGHAAWLRRVWELLVATERAVASLEAGSPDTDALRRAAGADVVDVLPPLGLRANTQEGETESVNAKRDPPAFTADIPTRDAVPASDDDVRIVELELAAIDHLLAAARAERSMLGRRRRLLLGARQRLLDVSAALPLEREGARTRASFIAREIVRIDRLETAGLSVDVGLAHQARQAIDRGDPRRLYAALAAIDVAALASGDASVTRVTGKAMARMWDGADPTSPDAVEASLQASASELLGADVIDIVRRRLLRGRRRAHPHAYRRRGSLHRAGPSSNARSRPGSCA